MLLGFVVSSGNVCIWCGCMGTGVERRLCYVAYVDLYIFVKGSSHEIGVPSDFSFLSNPNLHILMI